MSLPFLFFAATIAICAMILPGISGAFVLLLLGVYHGVTGLIKEFAKGNLNVELITQLVTFAAGCLVGLLAFSRLLRWLLEHYRATTMASLTGLMIGSIAKLWPLQQPTAETAELEWKNRQWEYVSPTAWNGSLTFLTVLVITAAAGLIALEYWANTRTRPTRDRRST